MNAPAMSDAEMRGRAGEAAAEVVEDGMVLGLGTGRTAEAFLKALAERVRKGLQVVGVPTSERTASLAGELGITLTDLDAQPALDLTVDGADELDSALRLIKGGGGALLREKIVAAASRDMLVVADGGKVVETLGEYPLPIEVVPFGLSATRRHIERVAGDLGLAGALILRGGDADPFVTDNGNLILDASFRRLEAPERLANELSCLPGVVEHGLFINMASRAVIARPGGIEWMTR